MMVMMMWRDDDREIVAGTGGGSLADICTAGVTGDWWLTHRRWQPGDRYHGLAAALWLAVAYTALSLRDRSDIAGGPGRCGDVDDVVCCWSVGMMWRVMMVAIIESSIIIIISIIIDPATYYCIIMCNGCMAAAYGY
jgi:hypothetical protein